VTPVKATQPLYLAKVVRLLGDLQGAHPLLERVRGALEVAPDPRSEAEYLLEVGELAWTQGQHREARAVWAGLARLELGQEAQDEIEAALAARLEGVSA